jgi:histidinol-phosphate/aromatic aminotransferase/cobyric acid decarboxylase-like protein/adenosyl cobinamide kinase/adenosyl cobinamide phosphate guanylyltransferase
MPLVLVTGGTRSGKSEIAERLVAESGEGVDYVATLAPGDAETAERIAAHRARRPPEWTTLEGADPADAVEAGGGRAVLVDSLGPWIGALMEANGLLSDAPVEPLGPAGERARAEVLERVRRLARVAGGRPALTVVVAEESGLGPVPMGASTRRYLDLAGDAAQILSGAAAQVLLAVAGRALELAPAPVAPLEPALRLHGDAMVPPGAEDFAVNVRDEPAPPWLRRELEAALERSGPYPDERAAVRAVAERHGRPPEEVVLTNGGAEAFWLLGAALRPRHAVCVHPTFSEPETALRAHGRPVAHAFRRPHDMALDPEAVPTGADLVVTTNPNNPSGVLDPAAAVERLARPGRALVVDEAFMDFVPDEPETLAARRDLDGLVVVRSLTKLWSLAGLRAGYLLAPPRLAAAVRGLRPPWNVNALALAAIRACAGRPEAAGAIAAAVARAREQLRAGLDRLEGVRTFPSATNFVLARVRDGERVYRDLLGRGVAVRPVHDFPGLDADHLRIAVRGPEANARLLATMAEVTA